MSKLVLNRESYNSDDSGRNFVVYKGDDIVIVACLNGTGSICICNQVPIEIGSVVSEVTADISMNITKASDMVVVLLRKVGVDAIVVTEEENSAPEPEGNDAV